MRPHHFEHIKEVFNAVTHLIAFIGLPDGCDCFCFFYLFVVNSALIHFALKNLEYLDYITFRGEIDSQLNALLNKNGFSKRDNLSFPIVLKGSGKLYPF